MHKYLLFIYIIFAGLFAAGCGEEEIKREPAKVEGWKEYTDETTKFKIEFPSNWEVVYEKQFNRYIAWSTKKARQQSLFETMSGELEDEKAKEAKVQVWWKVLDSVNTFQSFFDMKTFDNDIYSDTVPVSIGEFKGVRQDFSFPVGFEGTWTGSMWYAINPDTLGGVLTILEFNTLGNSYEYYEPYFKKIIESISLPERPEEQAADTIIQKEVAPPPSNNFKTVSKESFSIRIPDNFSQEKLSYSPKGVKNYWNFMGKRRGDSNILIEELDPKGKDDLKKIVEELRKKVRNASTLKQVGIGGGQKGYVYAYVPRRNIQSQAYYAKKGNKLFRVTINYYTGKHSVTEEDERKNYENVFIRSAKSLTLK